MQKLSSWATQHLFTLRSQGVVPHRETPVSVNAGPSALASAPLDVPPEEEDTPPPLEDEEDEEDEDVGEEEELDPPLAGPSGMLLPVEASELAPLLVLPPQPGAPRAAQRMTAAVMASAGGLTTFMRSPPSPFGVALRTRRTDGGATMEVVPLAPFAIVVMEAGRLGPCRPLPDAVRRRALPIPSTFPKIGGLQGLIEWVCPEC